jgi:hypothetical protein
VDEPTGNIIPVWNGLLESPHIERIGPALWLFLWLLDRQTDDVNGYVYGHRLILYSDIAASLHKKAQTIGDHMRRLEHWRYVLLEHEGRKGTRIRINKPKKWQRPASKSSSSTIPGDFGEKWRRACELAGDDDPDFHNLEFKFWGQRGQAVRKLAEQFVDLGDGPIRFAFSEWTKMVDDYDARGQLDKVPTRPDTKLNRLLVFARRKARPRRAEAGNGKENGDPRVRAQREALYDKEEALIQRQGQGENVTKALRQVKAEIKAFKEEHGF